MSWIDVIGLFAVGFTAVVGIFAVQNAVRINRQKRP